MKYFLQVTHHILGRQQCQHSGFAWPLLKGIPVGLHLPLSQRGTAAAVPFLFLMFIST